MNKFTLQTINTMVAIGLLFYVVLTALPGVQ